MLSGFATAVLLISNALRSLHGRVSETGVSLLGGFAILYDGWRHLRMKVAYLTVGSVNAAVGLGAALLF